MTTLRPYQRESIDAVFDYWKTEGGNPLIDLATGTGKSVVLATLMLGTLTAIAATVRLSPAEAMRPASPGRYRRALLERLPGVATAPALRMVLRNIERRPLRSGLTALGIAASVGIIVLGNFSGMRWRSSCKPISTWACAANSCCGPLKPWTPVRPACWRGCRACSRWWPKVCKE